MLHQLTAPTKPANTMIRLDARKGIALLLWSAAARLRFYGLTQRHQVPVQGRLCAAHAQPIRNRKLALVRVGLALPV